MTPEVVSHLQPVLSRVRGLEEGLFIASYVVPATSHQFVGYAKIFAAAPVDPWDCNALLKETAVSTEAFAAMEGAECMALFALLALEESKPEPAT